MHFPNAPDGAGFLKMNRRPFGAVLSVLMLGAITSGCGASLEGGSHLTNASSSIGQTDALPGESAARVALGQKEAEEAAELAAASNPANSAYKIGPMDVVDVSVFQVPELSKTVQVAADGTINLPLAGEVPAAGRTPRDVERDLTERLGRDYLQSPQVNVYIKEYNSQRVTVDGSVRRPGVYPLHGPETLLQIIATAEGFTETADSTVVVFRTAAGTKSAARFDVGDIRSGKVEDPQIVEGDVVVVSNSTMKETYQAFLKVLPVGNLFVPFL